MCCAARADECVVISGFIVESGVLQLIESLVIICDKRCVAVVAQNEALTMLQFEPFRYDVHCTSPKLIIHTHMLLYHTKGICIPQQFHRVYMQSEGPFYIQRNSLQTRIRIVRSKNTLV